METPDLKRRSQFWKALTCHPLGVFDQVPDPIVQCCVDEKKKRKVDCLELQKVFHFLVPPSLLTPRIKQKGSNSTLMQRIMR